MSEVRILSPRPFSTPCETELVSAPVVRIKAQRERSILAGHPWLFTGAIQPSEERPTNGDLVRLVSAGGAPLGWGHWSTSGSISVRLLTRNESQPNDDWLTHQIATADRRRRYLGLGPETPTTGYRIVFGESDGLPGLVIDRYGEACVIQLTTAGMERWRDAIVAAVQQLPLVTAIVERSDNPSRRAEHLPNRCEVVVGSVNDAVPFQEDGEPASAAVLSGQKTGYYLDQRDLRATLRRISSGRRGLDLFSNSGSLSQASLTGGAAHMTLVDSSRPALEKAETDLTKRWSDRVELVEGDVFQWLGESHETYDLVLLDPPALVKNRRHLSEGAKAYHWLFRAVLRLLSPNGILAVSSCSQAFSRSLFRQTLSRAAVQAGGTARTIVELGQPVDHPVAPGFPESEYLTTALVELS